jgi:hypothetical protein
MKPRILFICPSAPWPQTSAELIRNSGLIAGLSRMFTVDLVVAEANDDRIPEAFAEFVDDYAIFPRPHPNTTLLQAIIAKIAQRSSNTATSWVSDALKDYVAERVGNCPYAAIHVDIQMMDALPNRDVIPIVYNAHTCQYRQKQQQSRMSSWPSSIVTEIAAQRLRPLEAALVQRATLVTTPTESVSRDFLTAYGYSPSKYAVVPNGVDVQRYASVRAIPPKPQTVLITGSMEKHSSLRGLLWFISEVLPHLRTLSQKPNVRVAGRMSPNVIRELAYAGIEAYPNPATMDEHLADATVIAAPIFAGEGPHMRILEAWAAGRPVITTTVGAYGLRHREDHEIIVRDNPFQFAEAIAHVLENTSKRGAITQAAAKRVIEYDWSMVTEQISHTYKRFTPSTPPSITPLTLNFSVQTEV